MERNDRPLGRKKNVIEGTAHVGRRETGASGGGQRSGGGGGSPLLKLIIAAAVLLLGGGGAMSGVLGGGGSSGTTPAQTPPQSTHAPAPSHAAGKLNTSVSKDARPKRVTLKGNGQDTTTILVYMCGTDLESGGGFATKDLQEMTAADLGGNVELYVFTGGCKAWKNSIVSSSKNEIYRVQDGGLGRIWQSSSLQPMTDPNTLASFIQWAAKNTSSDRYELIFWDHGGGSVSGYGYDEVYPRSGSMTLDGIAKALEAGGITFDFIGFDACLMATLETALVAEPYADYLIASEETEPGCGWYYTGWLNALGKNPSMTALEIGRNICDSFVSECGRVAARQQATLSVIDLAEFHGTVPGAFRNFAQATADSIQADNYKSVATARGKTKEFAQSSNIDQIDLIHLADNIDTKESQKLATVLREAVKYNAASSNISNANGVSIYFPYGRASSVNKMTKIYDQIGMDETYTDCVKSFASLEVAGQTVSGGSSAQLSSLFGALMSAGGNGGGSGGNAIGSLLSGGGLNNAAVVSQLLGALVQGSGRSLAEVGLTEDEAAFLDADLLERSSAYLAEHQFDPSALVWTEKDGQNVLSLTEEQWDLIRDVELNVFVDDGTGYIDLGLDNVFEFNSDGDLIGAYDQTWMCVNGQIVAYYMLSDEGTADDYKILGRIPAMLNGRRVNLVVCFTDEQPDGEILGADPDYDEETETATISRGLIEIQDGDVIDFLCNYYDYDRNFQDAYPLGAALTVSGPLEIRNIKMDNSAYIASYRLTDIYNNHYWTPSVT